MYNTPYNREIKRKIGKNVVDMIHNRDLVHAGENYDKITHRCQKCGEPYHGGKITFKNVLHGYDEIAKRVKPIVKPITSSLSNKAVRMIENYPTGGKLNFKNIVHDVGKRLSPIAKPIAHALTNKAISYGLETAGKYALPVAEDVGEAALVAAGMHRYRRSKTHKGEFDYTTKKGDKVHHINNHYVRDDGIPYNGIKNGGKISHHKRSSPWIQHIKDTQHQHGCTYKEAMSIAKGTYRK